MENNNKKLSTKLISIIQEQITKFFDKQKTLVKRDRAVVIEPSADNFTALVEIGTGEESTQHELKNKTGTSLQQGDLVSVETAGKIISYNDSVIAISENGVINGSGGVGEWTDLEHTSEIFNSYVDNAVEGISSKRNVCDLSFSTVKGFSNSLKCATDSQYDYSQYIANFIGGENNNIYSVRNGFVYGSNNYVGRDSCGYSVYGLSIIGDNNKLGYDNTLSEGENYYVDQLKVLGSNNYIGDEISHSIILGEKNGINSRITSLISDFNNGILLKNPIDNYYSMQYSYIIGQNSVINTYYTFDCLDNGKKKTSMKAVGANSNYIFGKNCGGYGDGNCLIGHYNSVSCMLPDYKLATKNSTFPYCNNCGIFGHNNNISSMNYGYIVGWGNRMYSYWAGSKAYSCIFGTQNTLRAGYGCTVVGHSNRIKTTSGNEYENFEDLLVLGNTNEVNISSTSGRSGFVIGDDNKINAAEGLILGIENKITTTAQYTFNNIFGRANETNGKYSTIIGERNRLTFTNLDTSNYNFYIGHYLETRDLSGDSFRVINMGTSLYSVVNSEERVNLFEVDKIGNGYLAGARILTELDLGTGSFSVQKISSSESDKEKEISELKSKVANLETQVILLTNILKENGLIKE